MLHSCLPTLLTVNKDWWHDALCREARKLFWNTITEDQSHRYPLPDETDTPAEEAAKVVCADCPVTKECLTQAYIDDEQFGVWGGTNSRERIRQVRRWRMRRRPTP